MSLRFSQGSSNHKSHIYKELQANATFLSERWDSNSSLLIRLLRNCLIFVEVFCEVFYLLPVIRQCNHKESGVKNIKNIGFCLICAFSSVAKAALPPLYQSKAEITQILRSTHLSKFESSDSIDSIFREGSDWIVKSGQKCLRVIVIPIENHANLVGPLRFELESGNLFTCE